MIMKRFTAAVLALTIAASAAMTAYADTKSDTGRNFLASMTKYSELSDAEVIKKAEGVSEAPKFTATMLTSEGAIIKWEKVTGIDGYLLYRYGGKDGYSHYILSADTTFFTWEDFDPTATYGLVTYVNVDGDTIKSPAVEKKGSEFDNVEIKAPAIPKYLKAGRGKTALRLYWEELECDGVQVWISTDNKEWNRYGDAGSGETNFRVDSLKEGTKYYFKLRSYNLKANNIPVFSDYTDVIELTTLGTAPSVTEPAPGTPVFTKAGRGKNAIRLYWEPLECDGVAVMMLDENEDWKEAGRAENGATDFRVEGLTPGTDYKFILYAYNKKADGTLVTGEYSDVIEVSTTGTKPVEVTAPDTPQCYKSGRGKTALRIYWKELDCDGVQVWMTDEKGVWKLAGETAKGVYNYRADGLTQGTTYNFKLVAFNNKPDGTKLFSEWTDVISLTTLGTAPVKAPDTPVFKSFGRGKTALRIYWEPLECDGVEVYIKDGAGWKLAGTAKKGVSNYRVEGLSQATTYSFRMRAFNTKSDGSKVYSGYSDICSCATTGELAKPDKVTISGVGKSTNAVRVYWKTQKCTGYEIYIYKNNKWLYVDSVPGNAANYRIEGLTPNTVYYVTVRAYNSDGKNNVVFGDFSDNKKVTTLQSKTAKVEAPPVVNVTKISKGKTAVRLRWDKLDCDGYEVYRRINGTYILASTLGKDADNVRYEGLTPSTAYYFRIRAFRFNGDGSKVFGEFGKNYKATTLDDPNAGPKIEVKNGVTYVNGILIANKTYSLPASYNPGGLTAETSAAFAKLQQAAKQDGIYLWCASGFRSYEYQKLLYESYVARDGKAAADTYSARPGHSEHQTGLALDVNNPSSSFNNTAEAKWLAAHCADYGFIIRYPYGKQASTGFVYESWHIRYLGVDLAKKVTASGKTLEEYLGITSVYNY